jgi:hypothetical protein
VLGIAGKWLDSRLGPLGGHGFLPKIIVCHTNK